MFALRTHSYTDSVIKYWVRVSVAIIKAADNIREECMRKRPGPKFFIMDNSEKAAAEKILIDAFQETDHLPNIPTTTADLVELLELNGIYVSATEANSIMQKLGFKGRHIPNQVDKLWLVVQEEKP